MTTAAAVAIEASDLGKDDRVGIVDTHQHLWDLKVLQPPWLPATGPLAGDHTPDDYLQATAGLGVERTVYMEVDVAPTQHRDEAAYALGLCGKRGSPIVGAVIGGRPDSEGFAAYMAAFRGDRRVKGLRQVLHAPTTPQGHCLRPEFVRGVRLLGEMRLVFDVCLPAAYLDDADRLAGECPDTQLVLDHCGNPDVQAGLLDTWRRAIDRLARRPKVACKISGIVASAKRGAWSADTLAPFVEHCRGAFGPDRLVFGTDWPVCTLVASPREWVEALQQIVAGWSLADRRKLLRDNAVRIYRL
jgi:predicted TIM-barrel fold metal-dependent hydrolase